MGAVRPDNPLFRYRDVVDDWPAFETAVASPLPATIWAHPARITREALRSLLAEAGIDARPVAWQPSALRLPAGLRPGAHWGQAAGLYHAQEEASMVPVTLLDPQPGHRVLDLCAAPGNKTAQAALALGNRGTVVANDVAKGRLAAIRHLIKRLGLMNVSVTCRPAQDYSPHAGGFDRVIADVPCSCEGTVRKSSQPSAQALCETRERLVARQTAILDKAVRLCRPGGRIVYSTCTFAPEENEQVVDALLRRYPDELRLLPVSLPGLYLAPGLTGWRGRTFLPELAQAVRLWPHHNNTGGFFIALLERVGGECREGARAAERPADGHWLEGIVQRYAIPGSALAGLRLVHRGRKYAQLIAADHEPPARPERVFFGLPTVGVQMKPPKLTTAGVMALGAYARRNVVELDESQAQAYTRRQVVTLQPGQGIGLGESGSVVVRRRGYGLGLGVVSPAAEDGSRHLASLYPRSWAAEVP
ncbi:RsmB/NOP family class I SAM-dependent RNA methyltransferase [Alkalilimnicola ehrlichii]|uniref:RsmB/NOP family class I SAM-dependent RNA methyltransferase n=1 Tax=Alkalilimnicola ehrlichii TaxID=351052 RepID=UPI003BA26E35